MILQTTFLNVYDNKHMIEDPKKMTSQDLIETIAVPKRLMTSLRDLHQEA